MVGMLGVTRCACTPEDGMVLVYHSAQGNAANRQAACRTSSQKTRLSLHRCPEDSEQRTSNTGKQIRRPKWICKCGKWISCMVGKAGLGQRQCLG